MTTTARSFPPPIRGGVTGGGYERIATVGCSDRTIRRRLTDWAQRGVGLEVLTAALAADDRPISPVCTRIVERTHSWRNGYGKLRRCTEKRRVIADLYLYLAATLTVLRLIKRARTLSRWPTRPTTRRLR